MATVPILMRSSAEVTPPYIRGMTEKVPSFWMLACSIGLLFILTAGTLANLFLVRAVSRTHEIAVHAALGGTGAQLFRHQVTESGLVSAVGTAFGCAIVWFGAAVLPHLAVNHAWWPSELTIDWRVMVIVAGVALGVALMLGLIPLLQFRGIELGTLLRNGAAGAVGYDLYEYR